MLYLKVLTHCQTDLWLSTYDCQRETRVHGLGTRPLTGFSSGSVPLACSVRLGACCDIAKTSEVVEIMTRDGLLCVCLSDLNVFLCYIGIGYGVY